MGLIYFMSLCDLKLAFKASVRFKTLSGTVTLLQVSVLITTKRTSWSSRHLYHKIIKKWYLKEPRLEIIDPRNKVLQT